MLSGPFFYDDLPIKGKSFNKKEIDIMACLAVGVSLEYTSSILTISHRSIVFHFKKIAEKLQCHSWDEATRIIEKSQKYISLKEHFISLCKKNLFEKDLQNFATKNTTEIYIVTLGKKPKFLAQRLKKDLEQLGFLVIFIDHNLDIIEDYQHAIYLVSKDYDYKSNELPKQELNKTIVFTDNTASKNGENSFILNDLKNYYQVFFEILKRIANVTNDDNYRQLKTFPSSASKRVSKNQTLFNFNIFKQRREQLIIGIFLFVTSIATLYFSFSRNFTENHIVKSLFNKGQIICSELLIPVEDVLLKRPKLIKRIEEKLHEATKQDKEIRSVVLVGIVGMGGVGKTTLARYYARSHKHQLIWELNAETKASLMHSFNDLAYAIAFNKEQKEELEFIQKIKNLEQKEKQLIIFVKSLLSQYQDWLLIYDNVENFAQIKAYFPNDPVAWGNGKVIITTRDGNLTNTSYIKPENIIEIAELSEAEALTLFCKILYNTEPQHLPGKQKGEIINFLAKIARFPLDISIAAYYIKNMKVSYQEYLQKIEQYNPDFENLQKTLLSETSNYAKTRYAIITLSLKELINQNPQFADLLLLISCLDSQNIPKKLLEASCASDLTVNSFMMHLKKFSLITSDSLNMGHHLFSLHRSTQHIALDYMSKHLHDHKPFNKIVWVLENYIENIIDFDTDLFALMKILTVHCESFLSHKELLSDDIIRTISVKLGALYVWLNEYEKAKAILEDCQQDLEQNDQDNHLSIFQTLMWLGMNETWQGRYKEAKNLLERSHAIYKNYDLKNYSEIAISLIGLGYTYRHLGEYEKAKDFLEQSVSLIEKYLPKNYSFLTQAMGHLSIICAKMGLYKDAKEIINKISKIIELHFSHGDARFAWCFASMGNVYKELGEYENAKEILEQSIARLQKTEDVSHWLAVRLSKDLTSLAEVYKEMGELQKAKETLELSLSIFKKSKNFCEDHPVMAANLRCMGDIYKELGEYEKAKGLLERSIVIYEKMQGKDQIEAAIVFNSLGQVYVNSGELEKGEKLIKQALNILKEKKHPHIYKCYENLSDLYLKKIGLNLSMSQKIQEYQAQALFYLKNALAIVNRYFPEQSPHIVRIQSKFAKLFNNTTNILEGQ